MSTVMISLRVFGEPRSVSGAAESSSLFLEVNRWT